ncbi:hypothetical protein ScPMuIL_018418 [Solemya velum]
MTDVCLYRVSVLCSFISVVDLSVRSKLLIHGNITTDEEPFGELLINKKLNQQPFNELWGDSLMNCVTECLVRQHCQSFSYHREKRYCSIYNVNDDSSLTESSGYVYSKIKTWPKLYLGPCKKKKCPENERCWSKDGNTIFCEPSECPELEPLPNSTLRLGTRGVGDTRTHVCDTGFYSSSYNHTSDAGTDWRIILRNCLENGTWDNDNTCLEAALCNGLPHEPRMTRNTSHPVFYPQTVKYSCEPGYTSNNGSGLRSCQEDGNWTDLDLNCAAEKICLNGTYSDTGLAPCTNYPLGYYQNANRSQYCIPCEKWNSGNGLYLG